MKNSKLYIEELGFPWKTQDPFIFCAYHEDIYPKGNENLGPDPTLLRGRDVGNDFTKKEGWRMYHGETVPGFPVHPHKGFETISINLGGLTDHADSLGAAGRFGNGDAQWMTAGKGIQHSEMFPLLNSDQNNKLELFQIWLNLPKSKKNVLPAFKMIWKEKVPKIELKDTHGYLTTLEIYAGTYQGNKAPSPPPNSWAASQENEIAIWLIKMRPNAEFLLPKVSKGINRELYYFKGETSEIDNQCILLNHSVKLLEPDASLIRNGKENSQLLLLQGKPINEPMYQYGPFVLNNETEVQKAFEEYQENQFGGWPWPHLEQTHGKHKGRFAKFADGTEEEM